MKQDEKKRGAAMVIVLCVLAVFLALSAAILLSGSVALNTARTNLVFERAKVQAVSLGDVFVEEMQRPLNGEGSYLAHYVRDSIMSGDWPNYNEAEDSPDDAVRVFTMDEDDSKKHQIKIEMYWTGNGRPDEDKMDPQKIELTIDVVSTLNGSEFRVRNQFKLATVAKNTWTWKPLGRE